MCAGPERGGLPARAAVACQPLHNQTWWRHKVVLRVVHACVSREAGHKRVVRVNFPRASESRRALPCRSTSPSGHEFQTQPTRVGVIAGPASGGADEAWRNITHGRSGGPTPYYSLWVCSLEPAVPPLSVLCAGALVAEPVRSVRWNGRVLRLSSTLLGPKRLLCGRLLRIPSHQCLGCGRLLVASVACQGLRIPPRRNHAVKTAQMTARGGQSARCQWSRTVGDC